MGNSLANISALLRASLLQVLRYQLRRRAIANPYQEYGITVADAEILDHVCSVESVTPRELSLTLNLDKSSISRYCNGLRSRGMLCIRENVTEGARLTIEATRNGTGLRAKLDQRNNEVMAASLEGLSATEVLAVELFLSKLSKLLGAVPVPARIGVHPVLHQISLLSRALDAAGDSVMGSQHTLPEWQILLSVSEAAGVVLSSALFEHLPLEPSFVSRAIKSFENAKLIQKSSSPFDDRTFLISLTQKGEGVVAKFYDSMLAVVTPLSKFFSQEEVTTAVSLLGRCAGRYSNCSWIGDFYGMHQVNSDAEIRKARSYYVENLVRLRKHSLLEDTLFSSRSKCFAFRHGNSIHAVAEIDDSSQTAYARNIFIPTTLLSEKVRTEVTRAVMLPVFASCDSDSIGMSAQLGAISFPHLATAGAQGQFILHRRALSPA